MRLRYVYKPLPAGVLPRFIVLTHPLSEEQPRWRHGVLVDGDARALVRGDAENHQVEVTAFGPEADRLALLEVIQGTLDRINDDLPKPAPYAEKELADYPGEYERIDDMEDAELEKQSVLVRKEDGTRAKVDPKKELDKTSEPSSRDPETLPLPTFLSYSHLDTRAKKVFELNLSALQHKNLIKPWHDGLINPGSLWREDIERNLADMDVFIGLLTNAFVASDFIQSVEVEAALKKLNESGRDFLFFLILLDDIPLKGLSVDRFQVIKPFGRSVSQCKNRREGFNEAQREIEAKIREVQAKRRGKNR